MSQRVTLKDVAAKAGVSFQTVSKVLNRRGKVSAITEQRILNAARTLGYRPNWLARNLREQKSRLIGFPWDAGLPQQANHIQERLLRSILGAAQETGYHLLCFTTQTGDGDPLALYGELFECGWVDGFVLSDVVFDDARIRFLQERSIPFVAFGRSNPDWSFPMVDIDGAEGMRQVIEHLLAQGCSRFAALAWPENSRPGQDRMAGFLEALLAAGLEFSAENLARGEGTFEFGMQTMTAWLERPLERRPHAVVGFNDAMAAGALCAAQQQGVQVGVDLAITGFDDNPVGRWLNPPLTTISLPVERVGQALVSQLVAILAGKPLEQDVVLLQPQLVVRGSSGFQKDG